MAQVQPRSSKHEMKAPPNDMVAEQAVIGACLIDQNAVDRALSVLKAADFYREAHRIIFGAIAVIQGRGEPVDIVTVCSDLHRQGTLVAVGGAEYLTSLIADMPTSAHMAIYVGEVQKTAVIRESMLIGAGLHQEAMGNPHDAAEMIGATIRKLDSLQERCHTGSEPLPVVESTRDDVEAIYARMSRDYEVSIARWGIPALDLRTGGLEDAGYLALKGGTNAGKTSLLCNVILSTARMAKQTGDPKAVVVPFAMEERSWRWPQRALCWLANIDSRALQNSHRLERAKREDPDIENKFWQAVGEYAELPIHLARGPQSLGAIEAYCKRLVRTHRPLLITLDYMQLLDKDEASGATEERAFRDVAERLTRLRDLVGCPIIGTSQVTKAMDGSEHTFGAKAFEHNADTVARIQRKRDEEKGWEEQCNLLCDKSRELENWGTMPLRTDFKTGRWYAVTENQS